MAWICVALCLLAAWLWLQKYWKLKKKRKPLERLHSGVAYGQIERSCPTSPDVNEAGHSDRVQNTVISTLEMNNGPLEHALSEGRPRELLLAHSRCAGEEVLIEHRPLDHILGEQRPRENMLLEQRPTEQLIVQRSRNNESSGLTQQSPHSSRHNNSDVASSQAGSSWELAPGMLMSTV